MKGVHLSQSTYIAQVGRPTSQKNQLMHYKGGPTYHHQLTLHSVIAQVHLSKVSTYLHKVKVFQKWSSIFLALCFFCAIHLFLTLDGMSFLSARECKPCSKSTVQLRTVMRIQGLIPRLSKLDPQSRLSAPNFKKKSAYL